MTRRHSAPGPWMIHWRHMLRPVTVASTTIFEGSPFGNDFTATWKGLYIFGICVAAWRVDT